jgi:hypothetical protein
MEKRTYQLQTKLYRVEDVLVSWGPIRLTLRQCFVLVLGGCGSLNLWSALSGLTTADTVSLVIRVTLALIPTGLSLLVATVRVADRYAEAWAMVLLWYVTQTRAYIWLPQRTLHPSKRKRKKNRPTERIHSHEKDTKIDNTPEEHRRK